jgi:NSS family neurotransmitter:Na+ symporter
MNWSMNGYTAPEEGAFGEFIGNGKLQLLLSFIFLALTAGVISKGIKKGIERATKILMPILFLIIVYMVIMALGLPGRNEAFSFIFSPDFSNLPPSGILEAVGHAFFTLSLGMGAMITYGSYMDKKESIFKNAALVVILDTVLAIAACVIMYTIIFSVPSVKDSISGSTVGMLFITLPNLLYTEIPFGTILAPVFYILVGFAALSSTISLLEVIVSLLIDKMKMSRQKATLIGAGTTYVISIFCALSLGAVDALSSFSIFGPGKEGVLSTLDHLASNWMLPVGGLFITIFVGWFMDQKIIQDEVGKFNDDGSVNFTYNMFKFFIRFIAPVAILAVIISVIFGKDFS